MKKCIKRHALATSRIALPYMIKAYYILFKTLGVLVGKIKEACSHFNVDIKHNFCFTHSFCWKVLNVKSFSN